MRKPATILTAVCAFFAGATVDYLIMARTQRPVPTSAAEVSDLIKRLRPLTKFPDEEWYRNGIEIIFYGKGVRLTLKMLSGSEYLSRGGTLREAVEQLTEPSKDIQEALRGWAQ